MPFVHCENTDCIYCKDRMCDTDEIWLDAEHSSETGCDRGWMLRWDESHEPVDGFQVGDEVYTDAGDWGVVTSIGYCTDDNYPVVIGKSGNPYGYYEGAIWHKTGKNYPEITEVLNKLSERG